MKLKPNIPHSFLPKKKLQPRGRGNHLLSDFLAHFKNGYERRHEFIYFRRTNFILSLLEILENEGFIRGFEKGSLGKLELSYRKRKISPQKNLSIDPTILDLLRTEPYTPPKKTELLAYECSESSLVKIYLKYRSGRPIFDYRAMRPLSVPSRRCYMGIQELRRLVKYREEHYGLTLKSFTKKRRDLKNLRLVRFQRISPAMREFPSKLASALAWNSRREWKEKPSLDPSNPLLKEMKASPLKILQRIYRRCRYSPLYQTPKLTFGTANLYVLSTSLGLLTHTQAIQYKVGGELLFVIPLG